MIRVARLKSRLFPVAVSSSSSLPLHHLPPNRSSSSLVHTALPVFAVVAQVLSPPSLLLQQQQQQQRSYQTSGYFCSEAEPAVATETEADKKAELAAIRLRNKLAAEDYNRRRAEYKRQVTALRRQYADEVAKQRAIDKAEQEALERMRTRKRLERQRLKNERSAQNAIREKEKRDQRAAEFQAYLDEVQRRRDERKRRYNAARKMIVDKLESVAHLWMTTPEEIEAAFTHEAEQRLWSYPGGVLGETNPTLDCHYWQQETHTWVPRRTYKSRRQVLLEQIEEWSYDNANIDDNFWNEERLGEREGIRQKARLRAMVRNFGLADLLRRQKSLLDEEFKSTILGFQKTAYSPSKDMLRDEKAIEREGARLLFEDPTRFFVFDQSFVRLDNTNPGEPTESSAYSGSALGAPVGLRDNLREYSYQKSVFPTMVGRELKPDTRTEREKKLQEKQDRMLAAARGDTNPSDLDVELAAREETIEHLQPDLDYDDNDWDSDDETWKQGLDPIKDHDIINTYRERRYSEADIEWVIEQLKEQIKHFESRLEDDVENMKQAARFKNLDNVAGRPTEGGISSVEDPVLSLSSEKLILLSDLDDEYTELSDAEISRRIKEIGLPESHIRAILNRERHD